MYFIIKLNIIGINLLVKKLRMIKLEEICKYFFLKNLEKFILNLNIIRFYDINNFIFNIIISITKNYP